MRALPGPSAPPRALLGGTRGRKRLAGGLFCTSEGLKRLIKRHQTAQLDVKTYQEKRK
nr:MAG TPA: hypothetical protein [Caudoviricetes sp.]